MQWIILGAPLFSTCAKRQYMAVIVGQNGRLMGSGYNGSPPGMGHCTDGYCPRLHSDSVHGSSYNNCVAIHSEINCINWSDRTGREGGTIYVNGPPCWDCGKVIAGSGLTRVVYLPDPHYYDWPRVLQLLRDAKLEVDAYDE